MSLNRNRNTPFFQYFLTFSTERAYKINLNCAGLPKIGYIIQAMNAPTNTAPNMMSHLERPLNGGFLLCAFSTDCSAARSEEIRYLVCNRLILTHLGVVFAFYSLYRHKKVMR